MVVVPPSQEQPPFDLNHMVQAVTNRMRWACPIITNKPLVYSGPGISGLVNLLPLPLYPPQAKYIDIQPGHNEHRAENCRPVKRSSNNSAALASPTTAPVTITVQPARFHSVQVVLPDPITNNCRHKSQIHQRQDSGISIVTRL